MTAESSDYDAPSDISDWAHPADRVHLEEVDKDKHYNIQIFTDGSKIQDKVGAAAILFKKEEEIQRIKAKLHKNCSNNQAEQIAILKALAALDNMDTKIEERFAAIYTDSKITLDLLRNNSKHNSIIDEILNSIRRLKEQNWVIHFSWIKAHVGYTGNELADKLAKEAALSKGMDFAYNKKPRTTIVTEIKEEGLQKWQEEWTNSMKGAACREFIPSVVQRMKQPIQLNFALTAVITGHGLTKSYLHRLGIIQDAICICLKEDQTAEHLIYRCDKLKPQRDKMIKEIESKHAKWPVNKVKLISNHLRVFKTFIQSIDFGELK